MTSRKSQSKSTGKRPVRRKPTKKTVVSTDGATPKKARWTVMVYLAGDNNLTEECAFAITEMEQVEDIGEALKNLNVLIQFDPRGSRLPTQRFCLEKDPTTKAVVLRPAKFRPHTSLGETDTGSSRTLSDFISWGIQTHPAYSYLVVLSGHAAGIENTFLLKDENPSGSLGLLDLKDAFRLIKAQHDVDIDIVGMDSCLMGMAEIGYQLRDTVKILIGSEGYSPLAGWPYRPILKEVIKSIQNTQVPTKPPGDQEANLDKERKELSKKIVQAYTRYYIDFVRGGIDVDQSAIDTSKARDLAEPLTKLGQKMTLLLKKKKDYPKFVDALILAHWDAQSYNGEIYVDLVDFCTRLKERMKGNFIDKEIEDACDAIIKVIKDYYILQSGYTGPSFQYSYGVSIYFPWYEVFPYYANLDFSSVSDWYQFLDTYVKETRRSPRKHSLTREESLLGDNTNTLPVRQVSGRQVSGRDDRPIIRSMRNAPISLTGISEAFSDEEKKQIIDKLKLLE